MCRWMLRSAHMQSFVRAFRPHAALEWLLCQWVFAGRRPKCLGSLGESCVVEVVQHVFNYLSRFSSDCLDPAEAQVRCNPPPPPFSYPEKQARTTSSTSLFQT